MYLSVRFLVVVIFVIYLSKVSVGSPPFTFAFSYWITPGMKIDLQLLDPARDYILMALYVVCLCCG